MKIYSFISLIEKHVDGLNQKSRAIIAIIANL